MMRQGCSSLSILALIGIPLAILVGCSRPFVSPLSVPPYRDQSSAPYDVTWKALIRALAMDNVPLRTIAKDSGVIATDEFASPIGVYADCGRVGDVVLEGEALVAFTVFVQSNRDGGTDFQVNNKMRTQAYRKGSSGKLKVDPVHQCASTGRWEANLADAVRRLVKE
jgi:hypothetical protein